MSNSNLYWIVPRDKPGLLYAMLKHYASNSFVSFEGDLSALDFSLIDKVESCKKSSAARGTLTGTSLTRATLTPELDFLVVPLNQETVNLIWKELSEKDHLVNQGIIHVQIEHNGVRVFGAYDNFHRECVIADKSVPIALLEELKSKGIIRSYRE